MIEIIQIANGDHGKIYIAKKDRYYPEQKVIELVKQGYIFELQNKSKISTYFMVKSRNGKEYLSTVADQTKLNNIAKIKKYEPQNPP